VPVLRYGVNRPWARPPRLRAGATAGADQQITINNTTITNRVRGRRGGDERYLPNAVVNRVNSGVLKSRRPAAVAAPIQHRR